MAFLKRIFIFSIFLFSYMACSIGYSVTVKAQPIALELVIFTTNKTVSAQKVRDLASAVTPVLKTYPGFISRAVGRSSDLGNQWVDIVRWRSMDDALLAAKKIVANKKMRQFISVMQGYKMYHFYL
ncbi:MAG: hypothetical protein P1U40_04315 [Coxiellaceae bacterium]|nr:hypothetical protein [Coxiellaceae bacterium]